MTPPTPRELWALGHARELAMRARGLVSPNPLVGAVILAPDGHVVGEGWHHGPGQPHAERVALNAAGEAAAGATLVCTLEPCSHTGRTPPCVDAVIAAGIRRVVVGSRDPLEATRRSGVTVLEAANIEVAIADGQHEVACRDINAPFFTTVLSRRPHVTLKLATSLDGKVATRTGETRWISGSRARALVHRWRADHDAVMVGIETALADDPALTARDVEGEVRQPVRVVLDSQGRLPLDSTLVRTANETPVIVAVAQDSPSGPVERLQERGVQVLAAGAGTVDLPGVLASLAQHDIQSVFAEGGPTVAAALLSAGLVDTVLWFVAPVMIGGQAAPEAIGGEGWAELAHAPRLHDVTVEQVGDDALITGRLTDVPSHEPGG